MFKYFIIVFSTIFSSESLTATVQSASSRVFKFFPNPMEVAHLCSSRVLVASREIGRPASEDNYWDGTISLDKLGHPTHADVELVLTAPATVTVDKEKGSVYHDVTDSGSYYIIFARSDNGTYNADFHVQGPPRGEFPQVAGLYRNGQDICGEYMPWTSAYVSSRLDTDSASKCGRRIVKHRKLITNGFLTDEGQWPWHAAILHIHIRSKLSAYKCGAVLIASRFVITAGHCVFELGRIIASDRVLVRLGQHNRLFIDSNTQEYRLADIILHKDYNIGTLENDIALLKLATGVRFTDHIQPVCLWDRDKTDLSYVVNQVGFVVGWGYNEEDSLADVLMQARMPVVSLLSCLNSNRPFFANYLSDTNYCAGFRNGTSVCNGDSGSGMFFEKDKIYRLRGIVSLSVVRKDRNLCDPMHYVLFTDGAKYLDWIESYVNEEGSSLGTS